MGCSIPCILRDGLPAKIRLRSSPKKGGKTGLGGEIDKRPAGCYIFYMSLIPSHSMHSVSECQASRASGLLPE